MTLQLCHLLAVYYVCMYIYCVIQTVYSTACFHVHMYVPIFGLRSHPLCAVSFTPGEAELESFVESLSPSERGNRAVIWALSVCCLYQWTHH